MKKAFDIIESTCVPLPLANVDTDQIIPARFLKATTRDESFFGENLFRDWRFHPDGTPVKEYRIPRATFAELEAFFAVSPEVCSFDRATDAPDYPHYYARYGTPELALAAAAEINRLFGDRVTAFVNGEHVNIGKKGSSKTQGVRDALACFGLKEEEAAVFGDDFNDLDMITALDGWAVATARPEVLKKAPHVCESVSAQAKIFLSERNRSNP